jgi:hypothetical protein
MPSVSLTIAYECPVFHIWFEYPELQLVFLIACNCSLYLVRNVRPVCPMCFSGQYTRFMWLLHLSVRGCCFIRLFIVFCFLNGIFLFSYP